MNLTMQIRTGDTFDPRVIALLDHHVTAARAQTAPGSAHALDLFGLRASDVAFWTGWDGETLAAVGALKTLSAEHGEVKSMHTLQTTRRRGFGGEMLRHIITKARARGMARLSLETGSWDYFKPALALSTGRMALSSAARSRAMSRIPTACS
ncbi:putative acetyltransferase [Bradyrhizobium sp. LM3.4]